MRQTHTGLLYPTAALASLGMNTLMPGCRGGDVRSAVGRQPGTCFDFKFITNHGRGVKELKTGPGVKVRVNVKALKS